MKHSFIKIIAGLLCSLALSVSTYSQRQLAILGSSTSYCFGPSTYDSCYVRRIQNFYNNNGVQVNLLNLAVPGSNCYNGMPSGYLPPANRANQQPDVMHNITRALELNPDVVLVSYPNNAYDIFDISEIMFCLRTIKQTANNAGKICYITSTQPRSQFDAADRVKLRIIKDSILMAFGQFAVNFYDGIADPATDSIAAPYRFQGNATMPADGIHLNDAGHAILAQRVEERFNAFANSPLPVTFLNFRAYMKDQETVIDWITTAEKNIKEFEIQRSADGIQFTTIQHIKAHNTAVENSYSCIDAKPFYSFNYYRIAAINNDNHPDYSRVINVANDRVAFALSRVYFNKSLLQAEIQSAKRQEVSIAVVSSTGQVITKTKATLDAGLSNIAITIPSISGGVYYVRITGNTFTPQVKSFIKQ